MFEMKGANKACTLRCRRWRCVNATIALYYYSIVVIIILCSLRNGGTIFCLLPTCQSFQYEVRYYCTLKSSLHTSIIISRIRGGGDYDYYTVSNENCYENNIISKNGRSDTYPSNIGNRRTPSKGIWKRIRSIRGGVDNEKLEDDEVEVKEDFDTSCVTSNDEDVVETPDSMTTLEDDANNRLDSSKREEKEGEDKPKGGIISSFISLFRAPSESNERVATTNTTGIAHKMPHGHDGRGGGGGNVAYATLPPPKSSSLVDEDSKDRQGHAEVDEKEEDEFVIETEITKVSFGDTNHDDNVEGTKSSGQPDINDTSKSLVVGKGNDSSAFVVPPSPHKVPSSSADRTRAEDLKKSKASKSKEVFIENANEITATIDVSLNNTQNETEVIAASNGTINDSNTTDLLSNASVTEDTPVGIGISQTEEDYTSTGYVSFV